MLEGEDRERALEVLLAAHSEMQNDERPVSDLLAALEKEFVLARPVVGSEGQCAPGRCPFCFPIAIFNEPPKDDEDLPRRIENEASNPEWWAPFDVPKPSPDHNQFHVGCSAFLGEVVARIGNSSAIAPGPNCPARKEEG